MWARLIRHKGGAAGLVIVIVVALAAIFAPVIAPADPVKIDLRAHLAPPSLSFTGLGAQPLGRDQLGRDVFSRMVYGARITLLVAVTSVILGGIVGIAIGLVAGYAGGILDRVLTRLIDAQLAFPLMLLVLIVIAALGPSLVNLVIVLALTSWTRYARLVRGEVLQLREREFVLSAVAAGARPLRIVLRHILPNVMTTAIVVASLELARVIVLESSLSFLGLGVQPPSPSWGRMLAEGRAYINSAWWLSVFPGLAIMLVVLSVNLIGDSLRDVLDPRRQGAR